MHSRASNHISILPMRCCSIFVLAACGSKASAVSSETPPADQCSLLQHHIDVHHGGASKEESNPSLQQLQQKQETAANDAAWFNCSEGDQVLAFHRGRDCSDFTEEELDLPLSTWPHLTRWCKL